MKEQLGERKNRLVNINKYIMLSTLMTLCVLGCKSEGSKRDSNDSLVIESCDSVSWFGVSFEFPLSEQIDSLNYVKNNVKFLNADLWSNETANGITIHDTFLVKNEYQISFYSKGNEKKFFVKKISWKSQPVYHGTVCNLISCDFNGKMIKASGGRFKITQQILNN